MRDAQIKDLAGSEVLTWNLDRIPKAVSEGMGPLVVRLKGDVVKMYHWWCVPVVDDGKFTKADQGTLWIRDVMAHGMVVGEHRKGTWDEVTNDYKLAGLY